MTVFEKYNKILVAVLFALTLVTGIFCGRTYGIDIDQIPEEDILFMNLKPYAELIFGADSEYTKRLGDADITTDIERDHGTAPLYISFPFAISGRFRGNPMNWLTAYRACIFFIFWLGLICMYLLVSNVTNSKLWGLASFLMLWLSPRFFAESTYNSMDPVAAACVVMTLYFGYHLYAGKDRDFFNPVMFGIVSAFSSNVRLTGIVVFGLVGIFYVGRVFAWEKWNIKYFMRGIAAILSFCIATYLITPAMWHGNVISFIKYVFVESAYHSRWSDYILAAGQLFHPELNPIKWWYSPAYISVTTPPVFLILILLGAVVLFVALVKNKGTELEKNTVFVLIPFVFVVIVLLTAVVLKTNLYNGWRHLYSLYGPLLVIGTYGAYSLPKLLKNKAQLIAKAIIGGAVVIQLVCCVGFIAVNHPFEYAYFNIFAGNEIEKNWDADYWGVASKQILERLSAEYEPGLVSNREAFYLQLAANYVDDEVKGNIIVEGFPDTDYIALNMIYTEYVLRSETEDWVDADEEVLDLYKRLLATEPLFEIKSGRCVLWKVYANE